MTQKKILITGAGGMLGTDLTQALKDDFDVVGLERRPVTHLTIPYDICDLTQARKTRDAILGHSPAVIIHAAALTDVDYCESHPDEAREANVGATDHVAQAARELGVPLIFYSTDYIFDGTKKTAYRETDAPNPLSVYGKTKWEAEQLIAANGCSAFIFRITWLFGIWGRCFPKAILRQAGEVQSLSVVGDQKGRPTWSMDVAQAMRTVLLEKEDALRRKGAAIYHLGNAGSTNWADYARFILKASGLDSIKVKDTSSAELGRPAPRPANSVLDLEKSQKELGLNLRSWQEATLEYLPKLKEETAAMEAKARAQAAEKENTA